MGHEQCDKPHFHALGSPMRLRSDRLRGERVHLDGQDVPVQLKVIDSLFVPLAK